MIVRSFSLAALSAGIAGAMLFADSASAGHRPDNEVTVGIAISVTGRFSEPSAHYLDAYKLYADQMNAKGGWLGHKVKLVIYDDKSDKQTSIKLYEKLITHDEVDFTLGPYSSGITDAVAPIFERYKYPTLAPGAASAIIWQKGRNYIFNTIALAGDFQKGALHIAKDIGVKRIAIIGENSLFPRESAKGAVVWAKKLGLEVVLNESYPKKQTDFTGLLTRIKSKRAEAIFSNSYYADAVAQIRQLKELDINLTLYAGTVGPGLPKFAESLGGTAEYVLGFSMWEPKPAILKHPGMAAFIDPYKERYGRMPNNLSAMPYAAIQILGDAVEKAGSFDRQKVWQTLRNMKTTTIMGPWKVDDAGLTKHEGLTFQILDNKRKIVWPKKLSEVPYKLPMPTWKDRPSS